MREIKNFMKSKSSWRCGNCKECLTPAQRRCNDELCWCWGNGWGGFSNKVSIWWSQWDRWAGVGPSKWVYLFWTYDPENPLDNTVSRQTDVETGDDRIVVWEFECIENEEARAMFREMIESLDSECVANLFRWNENDDRVRSWTLTPGAMAKFNALIANPTEESYAKLKTWLEQCCSYDPEEWQYPTPIITVWDPDPLPCTAESTSENSWTFFWISHSEYERSEVTASIETDPETWDSRVYASAWWVYLDPIFNFEGFIAPGWNEDGNCWRELFEVQDTECVKKLIWDFPNEWRELSPETCAALNALYQNPNMETWQAAREALENECLYY